MEFLLFPFLLIAVGGISGLHEKIADPVRMAYEPLKRGSRIFWNSIGPSSALGKYLKYEAKLTGVTFKGC